MPKVIKKRTARPAKEEGVKSILHHAKEFIEKNKRILLPIFIGVTAISVIAAGILIYRGTTANKAAGLELEAYNMYYGLHQKQPLQKDERYRKALEGFKKAYETKKSPSSLFYIASCYYSTGEYDNALKALTELNERFPDDERFVPLAYYKMAIISIKKGDNERAVKMLDVIYNYRTSSFKDLALVESARVLEAMGKKEDSLKKYEELSKNFPDSPFIGEAMKKLGEKKS